VVTDREFHARIVALCDNKVLRRKFHELDGHVAIFFHSVLEHLPDGIIGLGDRHRLVVAALAGGDLDEIDRAIQAHYQDAARRLPAQMSVASS
jgi:DNA-binding GntR family transcriptional regulator